MLKFSKATVALAFSAFATFAFAQTPPSDQALSVADYVKAQESGGLGANKRVAISSFFIQFVRDQGIERSAGSFGMFQAQSATYFTQTRGVDGQGHGQGSGVRHIHSGAAGRKIWPAL